MIVAVCGGKGGVGKSTCALNLADELDAVTVDCDLTTADLPAHGGPDLHDVLAGRVSPLEGVKSVGGIQILSCGRSLEGARAVDITRLPTVLDRVERRRERVVVDCPAGIARDVGTVLASADFAVLVTELSRAGVVDAWRTRRLALDLETAIGAVVINRVPANPEEELLERVESRFGAPVVSIERDDAVAKAQAAGRPIRRVDPAAPAVEAFEAVGQYLERAERSRFGRLGVDSLRS